MHSHKKPVSLSQMVEQLDERQREEYRKKVFPRVKNCIENWATLIAVYKEAQQSETPLTPQQLNEMLQKVDDLERTATKALSKSWTSDREARMLIDEQLKKATPQETSLKDMLDEILESVEAFGATEKKLKRQAEESDL